MLLTAFPLLISSHILSVISCRLQGRSGSYSEVVERSPPLRAEHLFMCGSACAWLQLNEVFRQAEQWGVRTGVVGDLRGRYGK